MVPVDALAVFVDHPRDDCISRVARRTEHPSIPYGHGRSAVVSMWKALEPPQLAEGFAHVIRLSGAAEVAEFLARLGLSAPDPPPVGFFKFPRTRHLLNTGGTAVTRDDLLMDPSDAAPFTDGTTHVTVQEKLDGANLGFELSSSYEVRAQNRSHAVCAESCAQFRGLITWLENHSWALCQLLQPEVEVLFGEWCFARHSVAYSRLPGLFVAFDIYNKRTRRFCSVDELELRLQGLPIPQVRTIAQRPFHSNQELLALLDVPSAYRDGAIEGVYLRIDEPATATAPHGVRRAKLVRPDFIQGIAAHWSSTEIVRNGVRPDLWPSEGAVE